MAKLDALAAAREELGHVTLKPKPREWLDTGFADLNAVLGHRAHGLQYGRITEVSGWESEGKTALALCLAALAQSQGALVVWADFENSFDPIWATARGLKLDAVILIQPFLGKFKGEKEERMSSAQELCAEIEHIIQHSKATKIFLVVDSVAAMMTAEEIDTEMMRQNLTTSMSRPKFFDKLMRRWMGMAQTKNALILLINQLRENPMARFEDPVYTPGGNAIRFYCHIRARIRRAKKGTIRRQGKIIGVQGVLVNHKNKSGSPERCEVAFKLRFDGPMEFLPASELKEDNE